MVCHILMGIIFHQKSERGMKKTLFLERERATRLKYGYLWGKCLRNESYSKLSLDLCFVRLQIPADM